MIGRTTVTVGVLVAGLVAAGSGTAADAATCRWTGRVLAMPAGMVSAQVLGTDGRYRFAGRAAAADGVWHPVLWSGGAPTVLSRRPGEAQDVNRAGDVVGTLTDGNHRAFRWRSGRLTVLATGGTTASAYGISTAGRIAGYGLDAAGSFFHGLLWDSDRPGRVTVVPPPAIDLYLFDISDTGVPVGEATPPGGGFSAPSQAVALTPTGFRWLPVPADTILSTAYGAGGTYVVGLSYQLVGRVPLIWTPTGYSALAGGEDLIPQAVDAAGLVAGSGPRDAVVWSSPAAAPVTMPYPTGTDGASASAVTDDGRVAGWSWRPDGRYRPTVWTCA